MHTFISILFLLGVILLVMELFIPGIGICGVCGVVCTISSAVLSLIYMENGVLFAVCEGVVLLVVIAVFAFFAKTLGLKDKLVLSGSFGDDKAGNLTSYIGKEGVCSTPLKPVGTVLFNNEYKECYSEGDFIKKGSDVTVTRCDGNRLYVREKTQN
ncbi:MAG: hypothetical protein IJS61_06625 [Firmicutes bacterium]|nr:hypothetical protein [Bacillota bacterium]